MATPTSNSVPLTNDNAFVDGLTQGSSWDFGGGSRTLTYSFNYYPGIGTSWGSAERAAVVSAFTAWSNVANIHFTAIQSGYYFYQTAANIAVTATGYDLYYYEGAVGAAIYPDPSLIQDRSDYPRPEGDIFLDNQTLSYIGGSSLFKEVALHEIGHSLGLKEPFSNGFQARPTFAELGIESFDTMRWTVMSYNTVTYADAVTPMPLDILAIQHIYGANTTYHAGNDIYALANDGAVRTIWDTGGTDTLSASGLAFGITLDLRDGQFSFSSPDGENGAATAIAYNVVVENALGTSYNDNLIGNAAGNVLDGSRGADVMSAGLGNDTYVVDNQGDSVTENADEGIDRVNVKIALAGGEYVLPDHIENGALLSAVAYNLTGNGLDNVLSGNAAANILTGSDGLDTLDGKGGADMLIGGAEGDIYYVDNLLDSVNESDADPLTGGVDEVRSTISYSLADTDGAGANGGNVENLTLMGIGAINGTGNGLDNVITGNAAANVLDGGAGADTLIGGAGNDSYIVDSPDDDVRETLAMGGVDLVKSSVDYTLGANLENLTLMGFAVNGIGNGLRNLLTGNDANNLLDGDAGVDTLRGGQGDDTYLVELIRLGGLAALQDAVTEYANQGNDTLQLRTEGDLGLMAATTLTLAANLENLDASGTGSNRLNLLGNAANNRLNGNEADNILNGGTGTDTMIGGRGNDTYVIDVGGDTVTESLDEGIDEIWVKVSGSPLFVQSMVVFDVLRCTSSAAFKISNDVADMPNFTYTLGENIENGKLINAIPFNLVGNDLDNMMTGNAYVNVLTGAGGADTLNGGAGADTLIGGLGDDIYYVDNALDIVSETDADPLTGGVDEVRSTIGYSLADTDGAGVNGGNVENLTLLGVAAINGTGNDLDNVISGNAAANVLDGGAGVDTLIGGLGNDTYWVDNLGDQVVETSSLVVGGIDLVKASISYVLGDNLENLLLIADGLLAPIDGTGNGLNNIITGNAAANVLGGMGGNDILIGGAGNDNLDGGSGIDRLLGGVGDDSYIVDLVTKGTGGAAVAALQDIVTETNATFNGIDTLQLRGSSGNSIATNLSLAAGLENLDASQTASSKLNLIGNAADNVLTGNDANNRLNGGAGHDILIGGDGNDILIGGLGNDELRGDNGADIFRFQFALNSASNVDRITDFSSSIDTIQLENAIFSKLTKIGELNASNFFAGEGGHAQDAYDFILYDTSTGVLSYDPDGIGVHAAVQFVSLVGLPTITSADFIVT